MLDFNIKHQLLFLRIGSQCIPFASHPICRFNWKKHFEKELKAVGRYIKENGVRISMHPDQFVLINALDKDIVKRSIAELQYHCDLLDAMHLNVTAKIQIHVGGRYGDKKAALNRFIERYKQLPISIKKRLVIENDDRLFDVADCLFIHQATKIPILFDSFHHDCLNSGESMKSALEKCMATWRKKDGIPMIDYSSQEPGGRKGKHATHIDEMLFRKFLEQVQGLNFDMMLEIKDKEKSALLAKKIYKNLNHE